MYTLISDLKQAIIGLSITAYSIKIKGSGISDELALIGAVGFCVLGSRLQANGFDFGIMHIGCVLVDEPIIAYR